MKRATDIVQNQTGPKRAKVEIAADIIIGIVGAGLAVTERIPLRFAHRIDAKTRRRKWLKPGRSIWDWGRGDPTS